MTGDVARAQTRTAMETASGHFFDLADPRPEDVWLEDVAHALSLTCRYAGQCERFYSVAEHACLVAWRLEGLGYPPKVVLRGLHHDSAEAYCGDVTHPLKCVLPEYAAIEARVQGAVDVGLGLAILSDHELTSIKDADDWALFVEAAQLMPSGGRDWSDAPSEVDGSPWELGWSPAEAETTFLAEHYRLDRGR